MILRIPDYRNARHWATIGGAAATRDFRLRMKIESPRTVSRTLLNRWRIGGCAENTSKNGTKCRTHGDRRGTGWYDPGIAGGVLSRSCTQPQLATVAGNGMHQRVPLGHFRVIPHTPSALSRFLLFDDQAGNSQGVRGRFPLVFPMDPFDDLPIPYGQRSPDR